MRPQSAALAVAALVLTASGVTGSDRVPAPASPPAAATPAQIQDLDLDKLQRPRKEPASTDLFRNPVAAPAPAAPPAAAAPPQPPAPPPAPPSAPALPFRFLGLLVEDGKATVYLERAGATLDARAGDSLPPDYQLQSISDTEVTFVYAPLGQKQVLQVPPP